MTEPTAAVPYRLADPTFVYLYDARAITVEVGEYVNSEREGELVETPERVQRVTLDGEWIYFGFEHCVRRVGVYAVVKLYARNA
jgi:hypothetical protein